MSVYRTIAPLVFLAIAVYSGERCGHVPLVFIYFCLPVSLLQRSSGVQFLNIALLNRNRRKHSHGPIAQSYSQYNTIQYNIMQCNLIQYNTINTIMLPYTKTRRLIFVHITVKDTTSIS